MFGSLPNIFTSFLKCTAQNWTPAEALTVLSRAEGLFHMPCPVYTSHCDVSLSTTSEHFWLAFNLWFIQTLKWDSKKQLPSWGFWWLFSPNLYLCGWFFLILITTEFPLVFFSDHFFSLLRSFWFLFLLF